MTRAASYGEAHRSPLDHLIASVRVRRVLPYIRRDTTLLDLGCGYRGDLLHRLEGYVRRGTGIDLSVDATATTKTITLLSGKVDAKLPLRTSSFGTATAMAIIEHVHHPEVMLSEIHRTLTPGGTVVITTPSRYGKPILELLAWLRVISRAEIADHKRYYEVATLTKALRAAGFRKVHVSHFGILYLNLLATGVK